MDKKQGLRKGVSQEVVSEIINHFYTTIFFLFMILTLIIVIPFWLSLITGWNVMDIPAEEFVPLTFMYWLNGCMIIILIFCAVIVLHWIDRLIKHSTFKQLKNGKIKNKNN